MQKIPCILFRGGTSKGPFFLQSDLPQAPTERDTLLLRIMGSPHIRQIDGIGGGDSLASKVAIVSPSETKDADVNYLFCQVHVNDPIVETTLNCGNMLSGVAPFAIMKGLVKATHPETRVRVYNVNTQSMIIATVQTPHGEITYQGDTHIDGVPGSAAPIKLSFLEPVGAKTGKLLPSGNVVDDIDGIPVSCVDVSVPMVIVPAEAVGKTGYESKHDLDVDKTFLQQLETVRQKAAKKMGFGDVSQSVSPKICIVSPPRSGGSIHSCYFTPFDCHSAHAVSGAMCLAAACFIEGSVPNSIAKLPPHGEGQFEQEVAIEHVSGEIDAFVHIVKSAGRIHFLDASCFRTARPLFEGHILIE